MAVRFRVDGEDVEIRRDDVSLLEALRDELGRHSPKDGCSPQGQCGCCTVLVDGVARVSCVTAVRRVAGRSVTTADGLAPEVAGSLVEGFVATGASQCGFCTPGILCRLAALGPQPDAGRIGTALLAHLCRCTGWRSILDAAGAPPAPVDRDLAAAARRAAIEGGATQRVGRAVVVGRGGFADDGAPPGALVAVPDGHGGWATGETLAEARTAAGRVPGRRSGQPPTWPIEVPPGDWDLTLQTTWVEPGYLEPDASWCEPGGEPASPLANGGAFGGKSASPAPAAARMLADRLGRPVRVLLAREDVVRLGPKRPPVAAGIRLDGTGILRLAETPGSAGGSGAEGGSSGSTGVPRPAGTQPLSDGVIGSSGAAGAAAAFAPGVTVETVPVLGPPTSSALRAAGWAEAAVLVAAVGALAGGRVGGASGRASVTSPTGAVAQATVDVDPRGLPTSVDVELSCGEPLDEIVLRSYATGAAHMALGWVLSEAIAVDADGVPQDLTIRSWGILRARDTPPIRVRLVASSGAAVNGSDAVYAAVAAAMWIAQGLPGRWPSRRGAFDR